MVYILRNLFVLQWYVLNNTNTFLTSKLLKQGHQYHKLHKVFFSKVYYRYSELIVKYNTCLNNLLQQGISEPVFNGDLV